MLCINFDDVACLEQVTGAFADKTHCRYDEMIAPASTSAFIWRVVSELSRQRNVLLANWFEYGWTTITVIFNYTGSPRVKTTQTVFF